MIVAKSLFFEDTTTNDPYVNREIVIRSRGVSTHENTPLSLVESTVHNTHEHIHKKVKKKKIRSARFDIFWTFSFFDVADRSRTKGGVTHLALQSRP